MSRASNIEAALRAIIREDDDQALTQKTIEIGRTALAQKEVVASGDLYAAIMSLKAPRECHTHTRGWNDCRAAAADLARAALAQPVAVDAELTAQLKGLVYSADLYSVLMEVANRISSPALPRMATAQLIKIDALRTAIDAQDGEATT